MKQVLVHVQRQPATSKRRELLDNFTYTKKQPIFLNVHYFRRNVHCIENFRDPIRKIGSFSRIFADAAVCSGMAM